MFSDDAMAEARFTECRWHGQIAGRVGPHMAMVDRVLDRATDKLASGPVTDTPDRTLSGIVDSVTAAGADVFADEFPRHKPFAPLACSHAADTLGERPRYEEWIAS